MSMRELGRTMGTRLRRRLALSLAGALTLGLAGCFDLEQDVTFNPDGTAGLVARVAVDREMEDVYTAIEALAKLSPDPALAAIGTGLCSSAALGVANAPPVEARRSVVGNRLICEVRRPAAQLSPEKIDPLGLGIFSMTQNGPRQWELALDLGKVPDITPMLMLLVLGEMQKRPEFQRGVSSTEMEDLTEKLKRGLTALTAVSMRDRYMQVTISAPRIVSSEGALSSDGKSARFRLTFAELAELALKPELRRGKRYRVTVSY